MKKYSSIAKSFFTTILLGASSLFASFSTPYGSEIEAVIFDCDGVLVQSDYLKFLAWKEALASKNISLSLEEYTPLVGNTSKNILLMLKRQKGIDIPEEIIELKNAKFKILQKKGVPPIPEMISLAKRLSDAKKNLGIKLGLASSARREEILENLRQVGLANAFDLVISGSDDLDSYIDLEGKNKPKPYIYIEAAKRLGITTSKCLVFEDTATGVEAAANAGMIAIAVPNQFTSQHDFSKATKIIRSYHDIPQEIFGSQAR
jgi:beta-phosphoglucomutase